MDGTGKACWICGAGDFTPRLFSPAPGDLVLAADGGLAYLKELGVTPDAVLGDFDSLGYRPTGEQVETFPVEKDDTDMGLAVNFGLRAGCERFYLYGGLGGRLSHTLANLQTLLGVARCGATGFLVGEELVAMTLAAHTAATFSADCAGELSVFSLTEKTAGVTISGAHYPMERGVLHCDMPLGVSNSFCGSTVGVSLEEGALALLWESPDADPAKIRIGTAI